MDVTPHELRDLDIADAFRGYNRDEVNDLLERAAATIETQSEKIRILTERVGSAVAETGRTRDNDDILQRTLILAQRAADDAVNSANDEARRTIESAEAQAAETLQRAHDELQRVNDVERARIEREILDLVSRRDLLVDDVAALEAWDTEYRGRLIAQIESDLQAARKRPEMSAATQPALAQVELDDVINRDRASTEVDAPNNSMRPTMPASDDPSVRDDNTMDVPIATPPVEWATIDSIVEVRATTVTDTGIRPTPADGIAGPLVGSATQTGAIHAAAPQGAVQTIAAGEPSGWSAAPTSPASATEVSLDDPVEALLERPSRAARRAKAEASDSMPDMARSSYLDEVLAAPSPRSTGPEIDLRAAEADRANLDDDEFFATLRDAVRDDAPLGPSTAELAAIDGDRDPSFREMFKRRR